MKALMLDGSVSTDPKAIYDQYFQIQLTTDPGSQIGNVLEGVGITRYLDAPMIKLFEVKRRIINCLEPQGWEILDVTLDSTGNIRVDARPPRS